MALLIDSSVFVEAERRRLPLSAVVALARDEEPIAIAALTASELLLGIHLSQPSPQRDLRESFIEEITDSLPIFDFDLAAARVYAGVWAELRREGNLIAPHDLQIGATALHHGYDVLTHNLRDFERIHHLKVRHPGW